MKIWTKKSSALDNDIDSSETTVPDDDTDCYLSLRSFEDFREICDRSHYRALPGNWVVLVADIKDSTGLVEAGRYRDVNTVGAMPIAAVRNAVGDNFPYVFGGDGASMVVRPEQEAQAINALLAVRRLVASNYGMHLRVGSVPVSRLNKLGAGVNVARYQISQGVTIAMFSGRGMTLADEIIKGGEDLHPSQESKKYIPDLTGLSCRWNKIPNRNGCILSLLIRSRPGVSESRERQIYANVLYQLERIITLDDDTNPANMDMATYKTASNMLRQERRMYERRVGNIAWLCRTIEIRLCHVLFYWRKLQKPVIDVLTYMRNMRVNADHRKFDDMIRMVIDCSEEQVKEIEDLLKVLHKEGKICYGIHQSQHSLLTCLVEDAQKGKHVHFVDGDAGGYTVAAKQMKQQLKDIAGSKMMASLT